MSEAMDAAKEGTEEKKKRYAGIHCLNTVAVYYGISVDVEGLVHKLGLEGKSLTPQDILRASKEIKFKSRLTKVNRYALEKMTVPAILVTRDGGYVILAKAQPDNVLLVYPFSQRPAVLPYEELEDIWDGDIILLIPRSHKDRDIKFGFRWFLPSILKYRRPLLEVLLAAFIIQILSICSPLITQSVIDKVLVHNSLSTLDVLSIALIAMLVFDMILSIARNYILVHTTSKIDVMLSSRLFDHLFRLPLRYFESRRIGDTVARVRELENIRRFLTGVPMMTLLDCVFLVLYIIILFSYSTILTWIALAVIPLLAFVSAAVTPVLRERLNNQFNCGAESQSYIVEAVTGVQTIKSFAIEPTVQKKWEGLLADYTLAGFKTTILSGTAGAVAKFIQRLFDVIILWYGAKLAMKGALTVGQLIAFRMLAARVSEPVMRLVQSWQDFQQTSISVSRLGDIFNSKPEKNAMGVNTRLPSVQGNIQFQAVSFRYTVEGPEIIKDMSFTIRPNTVVGIVGRSGSGKSTISKLIQRLYLPEGGKILIDGVDISSADPVWLRRQIGIVLQENFLFNASVRENIALHNPAASIEEIVRAARIAGADEFITELPNGYDTVVGEKGVGLSGGQKQRIAIARALLCNPKILIFDEATSALDYESESIIQRNLKDICRGRTVLIIAHRLSTLRDADAIMVIEKGKLVEYGPKQKLIEAKGLFWHLLQQQSGV
ncbi:MAG: type I secretion system permease/ATPase [Blautia sp.]|nr:type I secretion system permease/ATPase [Blautia sp.]MCM1283615.1 type I secretion system permease/ATPase [Roseburia sp.]MCM1430130.1 type I secretion system permease/ATPase [Muribaculaceae bacterium]MCM1493061.1 type I secretion system permease/ATPase [Muribaculaceae bacterium]